MYIKLLNIATIGLPTLHHLITHTNPKNNISEYITSHVWSKRKVLIYQEKKLDEKIKVRNVDDWQMSVIQSRAFFVFSTNREIIWLFDYLAAGLRLPPFSREHAQLHFCITRGQVSLVFSLWEIFFWTKRKLWKERL